MKTATKVRDASNEPSKVQAVYRLNPPYVQHDGREIEHVFVSGICNEWGFEVMAFESDERGAVLNWGELAEVRSTVDHALALNQMGYVIDYEEDE